LLGRSREAERIARLTAALEPSESQNNLRLYAYYQHLALRELGRVEEAGAALRRTAVVGEAESLNNFGTFNIARFEASTALWYTQEGKRTDADAALKRAEKLVEEVLSRDPDAASEALLRGAMAGYRAQIQLLRGAPDGIEAMVDGPIKSVLANVDVKNISADNLALSVLPLLFSSAWSAASMSGDHAGAEQSARNDLQWRFLTDSSTLWAQREANGARIRLAMALARQDKTTEAASVLEPVLAFFDLPAVRAGDSVLLDGLHAQALHALALATPARRSELLAEAKKRFDRMPPQVRRLRNWFIIGEDIEREIRRGARPAGA
jgi:tetratricopeptide (TPR) repeat protein